jgi:hypothetical protein
MLEPGVSGDSGCACDSSALVRAVAIAVRPRTGAPLALESADVANVAQLVERRLPKPKVAGSTPVVRFNESPATAGFGVRLLVTNRAGNVRGQRCDRRGAAICAQNAGGRAP